MTPLAYTQAIRSVLDHLERTQLPRIEEAADLVVHALTHSGAVYCSELGHGLHGDFVNRAGGLAAVQHFSFTFQVKDQSADCLKDRADPQPVERDLETVRVAVRSSRLRAGDVMLAGSVSGRNRVPVELALACRARGLKTIGFTSLAYAAEAKALHPSGRKLHEAVDVVIDTGAPFGDAAVDVPGVETKALPVSGVALLTAGWMLWGRVMEKMAGAGTPPTVFMSVNRPGGQEFYEKSLAAFHKRGY